MKQAVALSLLVFTGFAALVRPTGCPGQAEQPSPVEGTVDSILQAALRSWHVPGLAAVIVRDDRVIYLRAHGVREHGRPDAVTPDTVFPLASCTKAFTTTAMAILVDEGRMDWDDRVHKHLDWFRLADPLADGDVRMRDLVCHRTGLGNHDLLWYRAPWGPAEAVRRIGHIPLSRPFRTAFQYQTTMFTAAGLALGQAAGTSWERFVRDRVVEPLGMSGTSFTTTQALQASDHASPHRLDEQGRLHVLSWYRLETPDPAGSINSTARDLAHWLRFQLGNGTFEGRRLVSERQLAETHSPQTVIPLQGSAKGMNPETVQLNYGMAWVIQDYRGHRMISHGGAIDGFRAHVTLLPDDHLGIALLNNLDRTEMNLAISNTLVDRLLNLATRDWNTYVHAEVSRQRQANQDRVRALLAGRRPDSRPSRPLAAYAGAFENAGYGTAQVALDGEGLYWKWGTFRSPLEHLGGDTFLIDLDVLGPARVLFTLDASGQVASMKVIEVMDAAFLRAASSAAHP